MIDKQFIIVPPNSKGPTAKNWHKHGMSAADVERRRANNPRLNVGLLLGPDTGIIDVECDSPDAKDNLAALIPSDLLAAAPSWSSTRGRHYLFRYDDRFAGLKSKIVFREIEFRLGSDGKACQSLIPPSTVDGVTREWIVSLGDAEPQPLPKTVIEALLADNQKSTAQFDGEADPFLGDIEEELRRAKIAKLQAYFDRHEIPHTLVREWKKTYFKFPYCLLRGPEHPDGANVVFVNAGGSHAYKCHHSKCADKTMTDVEEAFGPLDPVVKIGPDTDRVVSEVCRSLGRAHNLYQRGGMLVRITHEAERPPLCITHTTAPRLEPMPQASLGETISAVARVEKWNERKGEWVRCAVPDAITRAVDARPSWPTVPRMEGIVSHPAFLTDGSILDRPGYHKPSGLYFDSTTDYPPMMTVAKAIKTISTVLCDFPFRNDADRSAWISALLTLFARHAFDGPAPIFLIDANTRGSGKTKLADCLALIVEDRPAARTAAPASDDEWRKLLTSIALAAPPYTLLDNLRGRFGSPSLEQALTGGRWSDRVLGSSKVIDVPLRCVWVATSNNATMTSDMVRRTLPIRLESPLEKPEERTKFKHADLLGWVRTHRPRLAVAAISILHEYHLAARPSQNLPAFGSFEQWSGLVRSAVVWAGLPDPCSNRALLAEASDDETAILRQLINGWSEFGEPRSVADAFKTLQEAPEDLYPTIRAVIGELDGDKRKALGYMLRSARGRVLDGRKFEKTTHDIPRWKVVPAA